VEYYQPATELIDRYSAQCLRRIWKACASRGGHLDHAQVSEDPSASAQLANSTILTGSAARSPARQTTSIAFESPLVRGMNGVALENTGSVDRRLLKFEEVVGNQDGDDSGGQGDIR